MPTIMEDGFSTTISFSSALLSSASVLTVAMKELEVSPPGVDGGEKIDVTTMRNTTWRTFAPRNLKTLLEAPVVVAWSPDLYDEMNAMINDNQLITMTLPDTATIAFWGFVKSFTPNAMVEGTQPTANISIEPTNRNASQVETAPVVTEV